jgi:hypothetical protein
MGLATVIIKAGGKPPPTLIYKPILNAFQAGYQSFVGT